MKSLRLSVSVFLFSLLMLLLPMPALASENTLTLDKNQYRPGEKITVYFTTASILPDDAWIGLVPEGVSSGRELVSDKVIVRQSLDGRTSGVLTFQAPAEEGRYEFRMIDSNSFGKLVFTLGFYVSKLPDTFATTIELDQNHCRIGGYITVKVLDPAGWLMDDAWIGILNADMPRIDEKTDDEHDLRRQRVKDFPDGIVKIQAPVEEGLYEARLYDTDKNGRLLDQKPFVVYKVSYPTGLEPVTLKTDKKQYTPGEKIVVSFTDPDLYLREDAWAGVFKSWLQHSTKEFENDGRSEQNVKEYTQKRTSGELIFTAPNGEGEYFVRLFDTDSTDGAEVAHVSFKVDNRPEVFYPEDASFELSAFASDMRVSLSWSPDTTNNYLLGYNIYKGLVSGQESINPINKSPIDTNSFDDDSVDNGITYYYYVRPVYGSREIYGSIKEGEPSNEASATPGSVPRFLRIVLQIDNPRMTVNGASREIDPGKGTAPTLVEGRTLLPIRSIIESIGGTVAWDESSRKVTIKVRDRTIALWIDNDMAMVDGVRETIEVGPQIIGGRTMVPLRFVADNLGVKTGWDGENKIVTLNFDR